MEDAFISKVRKIVSEKYAEPLFNTESLIEQTGLSQTHFRRKLKAITGNSPNQFIQSFRLEKARQLLQHTDLNIADISVLVGFIDPSYFSRIFLKSFGVSPRDFRRNRK